MYIGDYINLVQQRPNMIKVYHEHEIAASMGWLPDTTFVLYADYEAARKEWEAKEKALRELANEWASFSWAPFMNPAARLKAILNTPAAGGKEQP